MVVMNLMFIISIKLKETYHNWLESKRLRRLRNISIIEQKYMFFDYRKFFFSSLGQQVKFHQEDIIYNSPSIYHKQELIPTELYQEEVVKDSTDIEPSGEELGPDAVDNILPGPYVVVSEEAMQ